MTDQTLYSIVLAAGTASRFGATKQLAEFAGRPLLSHAIDRARQVTPGRYVVVLGANAAEILGKLRPDDGFVALNPDFGDGMSTSLASGVGAIENHAGGALILLADQPLISENYLRDLIQAWQNSPEKIVASSFAGVLSPPAIFPSSDFDELMTLTGDRGAKVMFDEHAERLVTLECPDAAMDVDTPADLD